METFCRRRGAGAENARETVLALRTARGVRLAMSADFFGGGGGGGLFDSRAAAAVECPFGNTDYALSAAWAFKAWDGTPVLCTLTAMKAPFSFMPASAGGVGGGRDAGSAVKRQIRGNQSPSWHGRMEVRCASLSYSEFAHSSSARLVRYITNDVFALPFASSQTQQQQQQSDLFGGVISSSVAPAGIGSGLNGAHVDWFSRTDISVPGSEGVVSNAPPLSPTARGVVANLGKMRPLFRAVQGQACVDTTRAVH